MIKIAHRGNTAGPKPDLENSIDYLKYAISKGFDVEVDLWLKSDGYYTGHEDAQYKVDLDFLNNIKCNAWFHCKNLDAIYGCESNQFPNYFWHQNDNYALTSSNLIWTYPGMSYGNRSIVVDLGLNLEEKYPDAYGICGDYLE